MDFVKTNSGKWSLPAKNATIVFPKDLSLADCEKLIKTDYNYRESTTEYQGVTTTYRFVLVKATSDINKSDIGKGTAVTEIKNDFDLK